ncbi:MAG: hypothetical protein HZA50_01710 [Planctomycetes bacterium]|nr:hypothetical protein [Planctomycetota bacterium]
MRLTLGCLVAAAAAGACSMGLKGLAAASDSQSATQASSQPGSTPATSTQPFQHTQEYRGFTLQLHIADPRHPYDKCIDEIAKSPGAGLICLTVTAYMENCASNEINHDPKKVPSPEMAGNLISHARKKGLQVMFMPIVLLSNPREGEWRGKIKPDSWDAWWKAYEEYVVKYARAAQAARADIFCVGSELISTESQTDRWRGVVAAVKKVFTGKLTYSANWDHYDPVKFWDDLDLVGMTTYHDLSGGKEPTVELLMESWRPIREKILAWQAGVKRPIIFTEVAWPNQETCAQYPWNYYAAPTKPKPQWQANCFEAFFRTWAGQPNVAGFIVFEWWAHPDKPIGPADTSYAPQGKPAMDVINRYYARLAKEAAETPSSRPAARTKPAAENPQSTPARNDEARFIPRPD